MAQYITDQNERENYVSEIVFIRAIPDMIFEQHKPQRGRLLNRCEKLVKITDKLLRLYFPLTGKTKENVEKKMENFGDRSGWHGTEKHVTSVISFVLDIIEDRDYKNTPGLVDTLNDIFDYFDRHERANINDIKKGINANKAWSSLVS